MGEGSAYPSGSGPDRTRQGRPGRVGERRRRREPWRRWGAGLQLALCRPRGLQCLFIPAAQPPQGRPTTALPNVQPQGKQTALASVFKAPPGVSEPRPGGETESRAASAGVGGAGSQVGPLSRPLIHLFSECLFYVTPGSRLGIKPPHDGPSQLTLGETKSRVAKG